MRVYKLQGTAAAKFDTAMLAVVVQATLTSSSNVGQLNG